MRTPESILYRLSELLGCDPELWYIECAIEDLQDEVQRAQKTIGELRGRLAAENQERFLVLRQASDSADCQVDPSGETGQPDAQFSHSLVRED